MDQLPPKNAAQQEPTSGQKKEPATDDNPNGPSTNFAALIDAIIAEGRAYRAEEKREDKGKTFREWITVFLLGLTMCAIFWQVYEMINVYGPIRDQAIASKVAADAATKQSENSDKSLIEAQRAWVGPYNANIMAEPAIGKPVEITIEYQNTGREPALGFIYSIDPFLITPEEDANWSVNTKLQNSMNICKATEKWQGGSVVYPYTGSRSSYVLNTKNIADFVDEDFTKGNKLMVVQGCFLYKTFNLPRYSHFCYFYKQGYSKPQNLNICHSGQDAD
jgi:hypothetical protein